MMLSSFEKKDFVKSRRVPMTKILVGQINLLPKPPRNFRIKRF